MSYWNFRVIEFKDEDGAQRRAIHAVHYTSAGRAYAFSEQPASIAWAENTGESGDQILARIAAALRKPVMAEREFYLDGEASPTTLH